jgi:hypothetical protein
MPLYLTETLTLVETHLRTTLSGVLNQAFLSTIAARKETITVIF